MPNLWRLIAVVTSITSLLWILGLPGYPDDDVNDQTLSCKPVVEAPPLAWLPVVIYGMSPNFKRLTERAFPVGSCERDLIKWMDYMRFGDTQKSSSDVVFVDTDAAMKRASNRRKDNTFVFLRFVRSEALIGQSIFSVAWRADATGHLIEVVADTEHFYFEMP